LFLLAGLCAFGQQQTDKSGFVRAQFGFISANSYRDLYYLTQPEDLKEPMQYAPLSFAKTLLHSQNEYFGPPAFSIFWKSPTTGAFELIKQLPAKALSSKKNYVMWVTNPKEFKEGKAPQLQFREIDLSTKKYPYGTITVINFTQRPIAATIQETVLKGITQDGASAKIKGDTALIKVLTYDDERDEIMSAYTANLFVSKDSRHFLFLFPTLRNKPAYLDTNVIVDSKPPSQQDLLNYQPSEI